MSQGVVAAYVVTKKVEFTPAQ